MNLLRNLQIAFKIFQTHKTRALLSVLGIVIGIMSVIAVINASSSLKKFILDQVEVFGTDYIQVEIKIPATKHNSIQNAQGLAQGIEITTLKIANSQAIQKHPNISHTYAGILGQEIISYQDINQVGTLWGVTEGFFSIDKNKIEFGRPFTEDEDKSLSQLVILGAGIKQDLFGDTDAIGQQIKIGKNKFKVIGVRQNIGVSTFVDFDDMIILPLRTLQKKILGLDHVSFIRASLVDASLIEQTAADITAIMRQEHQITDPAKDDFAIITSTQALDIIDTIFNALTILLVAVAAISLLVGGVGVMNIMYVSVFERTYEIGLRKAVGAKNSDILTQFLAEAILITSLGGIIGVIFGILITLLISLLARSQGLAVDFIVSLPGIFISVIFMILIGLIFGIYPARRAATFDPVEALRYE